MNFPVILKEKKRKMVCRVQGTVEKKKLVQVLLAICHVRFVNELRACGC